MDDGRILTFSNFVFSFCGELCLPFVAWKFLFIGNGGRICPLIGSIIGDVSWRALTRGCQTGKNCFICGLT